MDGSAMPTIPTTEMTVLSGKKVSRLLLVALDLLTDLLKCSVGWTACCQGTQEDS
jgi:hypothetical protein